MAEPRPTNRPAHEVRVGLVRATIWANETKQGLKYNVTLSRLYQAGEKWKSSGSFGLRDLADVTRVSVTAEAWVREHQPVEEKEGEKREVAA